MKKYVINFSFIDKNKVVHRNIIVAEKDFQTELANLYAICCVLVFGGRLSSAHIYIHRYNKKLPSTIFYDLNITRDNTKSEVTDED